IDDVLKNDKKSAERIKIIIEATKYAHSKYNMKVYVWCHEFSGISKIQPIIYTTPNAKVWKGRKEAYKKALKEIIPDVDGIILMFGSAPVTPWSTISTAPQAYRIQKIVEYIGGYVTKDLNKELFIRTFVHNPLEVPWHSMGLKSVKDVEFTGMHKGPVQDWEPYNPHHPCIGNIGNHPCVEELDVAGEYYGLAILPFCAPGYYRYRLNHLWKNNGEGAVMRVERGTNSAFNTPNEINVYAVSQFINDRNKPIEEIWDEFIGYYYKQPKVSENAKALKEILKNTFPIRRKSHYVRGIWAFAKSSDFPKSTKLSDGQFFSRGMMPQWDSAWLDEWSALAAFISKQTILHIWQEGTEAVGLANESLEKFKKLDISEKKDETHKWLLHQKYTTEAWLDIDLITWSLKYRKTHPFEKKTKNWITWAYNDLIRIHDRMVEDGLSDVKVQSPASLKKFMDTVKENVGSGKGSKPQTFLFSPVKTVDVDSNSVTIEFSTNKTAKVSIDYGLELPDYTNTKDIGKVEVNTLQTVTIPGLEPNSRYVVRLRGTYKNKEYLGGDFWIFTPVK
ncbi:MAG: hypothetical protein J7M20_08620, partial [Deltaproteobacteria bacterium]|nr:hypothetical protein [Deltaproteobacteria bacterium]